MTEWWRAWADSHVAWVQYQHYSVAHHRNFELTDWSSFNPSTTRSCITEALSIQTEAVSIPSRLSSSKIWANRLKHFQELLMESGYIFIYLYMKLIMKSLSGNYLQMNNDCDTASGTVYVTSQARKMFIFFWYWNKIS